MNDDGGGDVMGWLLFVVAVVCAYFYSRSRTKEFNEERGSLTTELEKLWQERIEWVKKMVSQEQQLRQAAQVIADREQHARLLEFQLNDSRKVNMPPPRYDPVRSEGDGADVLPPQTDERGKHGASIDELYGP